MKHAATDAEIRERAERLRSPTDRDEPVEYPWVTEVGGRSPTYKQAREFAKALEAELGEAADQFKPFLSVRRIARAYPGGTPDGPTGFTKAWMYDANALSDPVRTPTLSMVRDDAMGFTEPVWITTVEPTGGTPETEEREMLRQDVLDDALEALEETTALLKAKLTESDHLDRLQCKANRLFIRSLRAASPEVETEEPTGNISAEEERVEREMLNDDGTPTYAPPTPESLRAAAEWFRENAPEVRAPAYGPSAWMAIDFIAHRLEHRRPPHGGDDE